MNVREKAESLGGKIIPAPNAMYAGGFKSRDNIMHFVAWLEENGFSYSDIITMRNGTFDIRYEK